MLDEVIESTHPKFTDLSKFKPWLRPEENGTLIPNTSHPCIVCGDRPVHLRNGSEWICERCYNAATGKSGNGPAPAAPGPKAMFTSDSPEWYTPPEIVSSVLDVVGDI